MCLDLNVKSFWDTVNVIHVKLYMMVLFIELYLFIPLSLTTFWGHGSIRQMQNFQVVCFNLKNLIQSNFITGLLYIHYSSCRQCCIYFGYVQGRQLLTYFLFSWRCFKQKYKWQKQNTTFIPAIKLYGFSLSALIIFFKMYLYMLCSLVLVVCSFLLMSNFCAFQVIR